MAGERRHTHGNREDEVEAAARAPRVSGAIAVDHGETSLCWDVKRMVLTPDLELTSVCLKRMTVRASDV